MRPLPFKKIHDAARRILDANARSTIKLTTTVLGPWNPATQSRPKIPTTYTFLATVTDYTEEEINGTSVRTGDRRVLIPAYRLEGKEPNSSDMIEVDGVRMLIVIVKRRGPADNPDFFAIQIRNG